MARRALPSAAAALLLLAACSAPDRGGPVPETAASTSAAGAAGSPAPPSMSPSSRAGTEPSFDLYLALGDSLAAGYQPASSGDPTDLTGGYAGAVAEELPGAPDLVNLGCPGESTVTVLAGGVCRYPGGSQAAAAEAVLAQQPDRGARTLVTVQVGANDVQRCVALGGQQPSVDEECVSAGLADVRARLPGLLERLRAAAPRARLVLLDYYDPFTVAALLGPRARPLATRSGEVQAELNALVAAAAAAAGADVAEVGGAFALAGTPAGDGRPTVGPVCSLTWMCADPPDVHATDEGYALMADVVLAAVRGAG